MAPRQLKSLRIQALFRFKNRDETIHPRDETTFVTGEDIAKPGPIINPSNKAGRQNQTDRPRSQGTVMIKALSAVAVAAFIAAALTVLPGFAPQVSASTPVPLAKADRLDIRPAGAVCSQQAWPNFDVSCLRAAGSRTVVREARLITAGHR